MYVHIFYQNKLTAKVYVREISEIWSSVEVYVLKIQKFIYFIYLFIFWCGNLNFADLISEKTAKISTKEIFF